MIAKDFSRYRLIEATRPIGSGPWDTPLAQRAADIERDLKAYEATITQAEDRRQFAVLGGIWASYREAHDEIASRAGPTPSGSLGGRSERLSGEVDAVLTTMIEWNRLEGVRSIEKTDAATRAASAAVVLMLVAALLLSALALYFNQTVERPMKALADTARAVALGDLNVRAKVEGTLEVATVARELNEMLDARARAEAETRSLNAELEQRVEDRTAELTTTNRTLEHEIGERKRIEQALRIKNDELKGFAYTASHDLKAPLRGIAGYAQELQRRHQGGLAERALFCIQQIHSATMSLDHLIDDLLQYSRVHAETPSAAAFDLPALVQGILRHRGTIAEGVVEIATDLRVTTMREWERGVTQVLTNLIDNGIKYSRHATPPRIVIEAEETPAAYRLTVRDNGIGFDMKYHDRIFGLFNRLVRQDEFEGTGAGLAIVKKFVEKRGGRIWAESQPGAGASFFVEFPKGEA